MADQNINTSKDDKKFKLVVNVINTQYEVIKKVAELYNFALSINDEEDYDLYWHDLGIEPELLSRMKGYQKINHFPGMNGIAKKNHLGKNLYKMKKMFPDQYNFFPKTWLLPSDWNSLKQELAKNNNHYYIVKPEGLSQGQGIFLTKTFGELHPDDHFVVQKYLKFPYLIDGLKFDLRIYVLVYGCDPLRIYYFREGLARFCTEPYQPPVTSNCTNLYMHLTNYAINKNSDKYIFNADQNQCDVGHKRSLTSIWNHIDRNGGNSQKIISDIQSNIVKTLISVQPSLSSIYHTCQTNDLKNDMCFEILGFDVILDSKLTPYILEVNQAPSFNTDSPFDESVKSALLKETFSILNCKINSRMQYYKELRTVTEERMYRGKHLKHTQSERKEELAKNMANRDEYEKSIIKEFTLIYPSANANYDSLLEGAKLIFSGISKARKIQLDQELAEKLEKNKEKFKKLLPFRIGGQITVDQMRSTIKPAVSIFTSMT